MTIIKADAVTTVDVDFTRESSQTFSSDTTYQMGGLPWLKQNTASEQTSASVGVSGLVFNPNSASDYNTASFRTLPMMALRLRDAFNFNLSMGLRVWTYQPVNGADANYENAVMTLGTGSFNYEYLIKRGQGLSGNGIAAHATHSGLRNQSYAEYVATLDATNEVFVLEIKSLAVPTYTVYAGQYRGRWPTMNELRPVIVYHVTAMNPTQLLADSTYVSLGAQRAGSGDTAYAPSFGRVRVDVMR